MNLIESPFATVRPRQRVTKSAGSRTKALLMAFKPRDMAELRLPRGWLHARLAATSECEHVVLKGRARSASLPVCRRVRRPGSLAWYTR